MTGGARATPTDELQNAVGRRFNTSRTVNSPLRSPREPGGELDYTTVDYFSETSLIDNPEPYYDFQLAQGPVWREPHYGMFIVSGYHEVASVQRDPDTFSSCNAFSGPFARLPEGTAGGDVDEVIQTYRHVFANSETLVTFDPPEHTAHRGLMMRLLTPRRLKDNEEFIWRAAAEEIERIAQHGECEFLGDFAQPFSMLVIADLLGIPQSDRPGLRERVLAKGSPGVVGQGLQGSHLQYLEEFFTQYIEDRRREPRNDVLTQMATAAFPDGSTPEVIDVVRAAAILFAGGQGSTARFQASAMKIIAEHQDLQSKLREDFTLIPDFIEEALRLYSTTKITFRMARKSVTLGGLDIPAGTTLMLLVAAADRDPRRFECPEVLRMDRTNARDHVGFGRGPHACPGGPLVRAETRIVLETALRRLQDIRISDTKHGPPGARHFEYTPSYITRGVEAVHLEFRAA
jgi:cytochrome P450